MDDKFNEQKDVLIAIKKEIKLLHQQVDYLIRNEKSLELLDLDVMMNRTHTIYDLMCGMDVSNEAMEEQPDEEALPVGLDSIRELFGIEEKTDEQPEEEESYEKEVEEESYEEEVENEEEEETGKTDEENEADAEENENAYFIEEVEDVAEEVEDVAEEKTPTEETAVEDRGFILNFEPVEEPVRTAENASVYTTGDEIEMSIPHLDFPEEETPLETPEESPAVIPEENPEEEIAYEPVVIGDIKEKEDGGFELETPETLGERLQQQQDPTLADKLQHSALNSLQSAIGINDKFLFVNELFNGSMEKYNRSIANLDDLKTLNGALIYLNELRIELQWNSSNEAYKKLLELVHRKFGA